VLCVYFGTTAICLCAPLPRGRFDFGPTVTDMAYLPYTLFSYFPAFIAGIDIRWTNAVLSLALVVVFWALFRRLGLSRTAEQSYVLALALYFVLPRAIGHDGNSELQLFSLALIGALGLIALGRDRLASAAYGVALGAMPMALFCAPPLFAFAARTRPPKELVRLSVIALTVGVVPIAVFLVWDAHAFITQVLNTPRIAWLDLDMLAANPSVLPKYLPYLGVWHLLGGSTLRVLYPALLLLLAAASVAWARTLYAALAWATVCYLVMVLAGPYVKPHMLQVVLYLTLLTAAVGSSPPVSEASPSVATVPAAGTRREAAAGSIPSPSGRGRG
jgi:hypothetical protein